jgi:hypothetical protein
MKQVVAMALTTFGLAIPSAPLGATDVPPEFGEIYELLRTNLSGVTEEELKHASVEGLLTQFRGRAALVGTIAPTNPAVSKFSVIERNVAVARVGRFDSRLAGELAGNYRAAGATNKL